MSWQSILFSVIGIILTAFVGWGSQRLIAFIDEKIKNIKFAKCLKNAVEIVARAVKTTYQTFVQTLKDKGEFDKESQIQALEQAKNIVLKQLSDDLKTFISENFGDVETWIQNTIESSIYDLKYEAKTKPTECE